MQPSKTKTALVSASHYPDGTVMFTVQHGTFILYHGESFEDALTYLEPVLQLAIPCGPKPTRKTGAHSAR